MASRGEIYFVDLNPARGREQAGKRPVLVVSADEINRQPLVLTVVAGTSGKNFRRDYATNVRVSPAETGLPDETVFMCFQIRSIDPSRITGPPAGRLAGSRMRDVEAALRLVMKL